MRHTCILVRKFYSFAIHQVSLTGTRGVPHWYCTPSQEMLMCFMSTAHPHGYCTYVIQGTANPLVSEKYWNSHKKLMLEKGTIKWSDIKLAPCEMTLHVKETALSVLKYCLAVFPISGIVNNTRMIIIKFSGGYAYFTVLWLWTQVQI